MRIISLIFIINRKILLLYKWWQYVRTTQNYYDT